jgi:hypothetical protein
LDINAGIQGLTIERKQSMSEKKHDNFKSPDLSKLQAVVIDRNTTIYVSPGDDPEEARKRFTSRVGYRRP